MRLSRLIFRSLAYYWRTNLAVIAGVAIAVAVLSGAMLVGKSVRESLRDLLFQRLGTTEYLVSADRFFHERLAGAFRSSGDAERAGGSCPIIYLQGVAIRETTGVRAYNVNVYGIDERFWKFQGAADRKAPEGRNALVGIALAQKLGIQQGDHLLLRIESQPGIPKESLYGRRENTGRTLRMTCGEILPAEQLGEFALRPSQGSILSIFMPLQRLQRDLEQPARANAILVNPASADNPLQQIRDALRQNVTLEDAGVKLRLLPSQRGIVIESSRIILDEPTAQAAFKAADDAGMKASGIFTYMANAIRAGGNEIPYSVITAADLGQGAMTSVHGTDGHPAISTPADAKDAIWLNDWARQDLGASPGDTVELDYYAWLGEGRLVTRTARFRVAGVVSIGGDVDTSLAPDLPGITAARSISAWDPPFPLDLHRIRRIDEDYWNRFRATPKAFVALARGQELWQSRFGKLTAVRVAFPAGIDVNSARKKLADALRRQLNPQLAGFAVTAIREQGLSASRGSADLGEYFVYFSFFLIAAAILLSALFFRLGIEQRVREIGTLQATGYATKTLQRLYYLEGMILSVGGILLGLLASVGYGWLLVFALQAWWGDAVGTHRLHLHISWVYLGAGSAVGVIASLGTISWTLRDLRRNSPRALLGGILESAAMRSRRARSLGIVSALAFLTAMLLLLGSAFGTISDLAGFFGAGFLLLVAILGVAAMFLRRNHPHPITGYGWPAFIHLAARNAMHRPGRSLLCMALIASATFIIVSVEAFRQDSQGVSLEPTSGTGGYPLVAESALPIVYDPNSSDGREAMGIPLSETPEFAQVKFVPFRKRPGDDASCLNLYAPQEPVILGASRSFIAGARFSFQDSLAATPEQKRNPWLLLESAHPDGTIPAVGDASTIQYILKLAVGKELTVRQSNGTLLRLRLVAALRDSIFQGELLISEENFLRAFPEQEGYRFFLLEVPQATAASLVRPLMERLADWGFQVETSRERVAAYHRVENAYLSAFQSLGALGLILGTAGLASVLLRNVLERRRELALLRAVGYRRQILAVIMVAENAVLIIWGLACGTVCALIAITPALHDRGTGFPAAMIALILLAVLTAGLTASILAVTVAFRSPLLETLRSE